MLKRRNLLIGSGAVLLAGTAATWCGLRHLGSMQDYTAAVTALRAPRDEPWRRSVQRHLWQSGFPRLAGAADAGLGLDGEG